MEKKQRKPRLSSKKYWLQLEELSSINITVRIMSRALTKQAISLRLILLNLDTGKEICCSHKLEKDETTSKDAKLTVKPGVQYDLNLQSVEGKLYDTISFKAEFSPEELLALMAKAALYVEKNPKHGQAHVQWPKHPIKFFYRNKPIQYWMDIVLTKAGMMIPYIKDNNGDPASNINNQINGLFFSAQGHRKTGLPQKGSIFGEIRFLVPAHMWLSQPMTRIYFADFYCIYKTHYITIVMTMAGSAVDMFCQERLKPLNKYYNPFLQISPKDNKVYVPDIENIWIEVLFTETVDTVNLLDYGCRFQGVKSTGQSTPGGLPKRKTCKVCSLY